MTLTQPRTSYRPHLKTDPRSPFDSSEFVVPVATRDSYRIDAAGHSDECVEDGCWRAPYKVSARETDERCKLHRDLEWYRQLTYERHR